MPKTISFHNGSTWSRGHNIRDERYTSKQEHIDKALTEQNVTIRDVPVRQAYDEIFGEAVEEYNAKQKRADRHIECYYDKIKQDKRKHPVYECIVQIGDRSDTGNTAEQEKQALIRFAEEWDKRNPNLRLVGAYIHCDEPDGTVHMHVDYIPVAKCSRGMRLQNSLDRALQQQGFKTENIHQTAQIAWQEREREVLASICRGLNIDAQHTQGIGQGRKYLTPQEYRRAKQEQQEQIDEDLQPLKAELDEYRELKVSAEDFVVEKKKVPFSNGKKVTVATEDIERLEEQAKVYRVNQKEVDTLRKRKKNLDEREQGLDGRKKGLDERSQGLADRERRLDERQTQLDKMYERQRGVNQLLEKSESTVSSLTAENGSLTSQLADRDKTIQTLQERLKNATQTIRGAYESVTNIVKAVGMLKYDKEDGYKVEGLSKKQEKLIDGLAEYGAKWAREDGFPEMAEEMEKRVGISKGIEKFVVPHAPKRSRDYEMEL